MLKVSLFRVLIFVLTVVSTVALAQGSGRRTLPADGKLGVLGESAPLPVVQLDGKSLRIAPGGIIFDEANRTIVHGALPPYAKVLYTTNRYGDVQRIYILTADEQRALERTSKR